MCLRLTFLQMARSWGGTLGPQSLKERRCTEEEATARVAAANEASMDGATASSVF